MTDETIIQPQKPRVIRKKTEYVVDGLGKVSVFEAYDPKVAMQAKEALTLYEGFAILGAMQGGRMSQIPVEFPIENNKDGKPITKLEECFDVFQDAAMARFHEMMKEAREAAAAEQKRIITAPAGAVPKLKLAD
jgi:hypothetical protein